MACPVRRAAVQRAVARRGGPAARARTGPRRAGRPSRKSQWSPISRSFTSTSRARPAVADVLGVARAEGHAQVAQARPGRARARAGRQRLPSEPFLDEVGRRGHRGPEPAEHPVTCRRRTFPASAACRAGTPRPPGYRPGGGAKISAHRCASSHGLADEHDVLAGHPLGRLEHHRIRQTRSGCPVVGGDLDGGDPLGARLGQAAAHQRLVLRPQGRPPVLARQAEIVGGPRGLRLEMIGVGEHGVGGREPAIRLISARPSCTSHATISGRREPAPACASGWSVSRNTSSPSRAAAGRKPCVTASVGFEAIRQSRTRPPC